MSSANSPAEECANLSDGTFLKFLEVKICSVLFHYKQTFSLVFVLCVPVLFSFVISHFVPSESPHEVFFFLLPLCIFPLALCTFVQLRRVSDSYHLHLPCAVLDPFQVDVTKAGPRHPLQAVHVVLIDLHAEDLRVALNVVPLGVGLQRLLDGGILQPGGQFR